MRSLFVAYLSKYKKQEKYAEDEEAAVEDVLDKARDIERTRMKEND